MIWKFALSLFASWSRKSSLPVDCSLAGDRPASYLFDTNEDVGPMMRIRRLVVASINGQVPKMSRFDIGGS